ncbi:MAG: 23S rRNA (pseudouridine(1915)-N(3))-methyltransferase RlmH [Clostridiaceae bacterium]|nr:23S rRNA (pseudouridine(1915)-N(3))-methyltransferase RlmH [Clostridiaceae bacterium]
MKIRFVCVGKIREPWLRGGLAEYTKRISRFTRLDFVEVTARPDSLTPEVALAREGEDLLAKLRPDEFVVLSDCRAPEISSEELAVEMEKWTEAGKGSFTIVIGGSNGLSEEVRQRADVAVSLSRVTFTHEMTRLIWLEQFYRGFRIARGETYHK